MFHFQLFSKTLVTVSTTVLIVIVFFPRAASAQKFSAAEVARYKKEAAAVTVIRDNWGIPHIYGKTDANAVFGLMYAECEDNFKGVEQNYLYQLGRQAEADGEKYLYQDVTLQLVADTADAIADYRSSAPWFKQLMDAFADGVNYFLYTHPGVKPLVFQRFKPWFALMFTDGSVSATVTGGINQTETAKFYGDADEKIGEVYRPDLDEREMGSNGFAIAPKRSASGHAMLYINPHVPFYFRDEVQISSEEGLDVYGAVTWGQFFIYQGFNPHCGWMHTSSYADVGDLYAEKVTQKDGKWFYAYDGKQKPLTSRQLKIKIKNGDKVDEKLITGYYTHHGPVLGARDGKWLALKANNRSYNALLESWLITKAKTFSGYKKAMDLLSNATNNTVYADDQGNIAFWYGNFMPKRNPAYDWALPVDGTISATEWQGLHTLDEIVHVYNPATGWIQNCNSTPFECSGKSSPDKNKYPAYMAPDGQNYRAVLAEELLRGDGPWTMDEIIAKGYDHYLAAFDELFKLLPEPERMPDSVRRRCGEAIDTLERWDRRSSVNSIATTLAVEWGTLMMRELPPAKTTEESTYQTARVHGFLQTRQADTLAIKLLGRAIGDLTKRYGTWKVRWGDINRYQRPADGVTFSDTAPSIPVGQTSSLFGQLPSYVSRPMNTQKRYGYSGNSFVSIVEFGSRIRAKSIVTGGESFDPGSKNYTDQAGMYIDGKFKDVLFYKADVLKNARRTYHPGK